MTEQERQQKEIERLQKKIRDLSAAYTETTMALERLRNDQPEKTHRGRPGVLPESKFRVVELCRQGKTFRQIAEMTGLALGSVHKIIKAAKEESRVVFVYMDRGNPSTIINAYGAIQKVEIINLTDDMINRAFGIREHPTWEDYENFLEDRCMPRTRYGIREELKYMGLDVYDPFMIIERTSGRVYGDSQWLKQLDRGEIERYDQIVKTQKDPDECRRQLTELFAQEEGEWL